MRLRLSLTTLAACLVTGLLAGCGDEGTSADEQQIRSTLTKALTSSDPAICSTLMTRGFLRQYTAEETVTSARRSCRRYVRSGLVTSVDVVSVETRSTRASAVVRPQGGSLPFEEASFSLRRTSGTWRLHRLTDGTLDRARFFQVSRETLTSPPVGLSDETTSCVLRSFKKVSSSRLAESFVGGSLPFLFKPALICGVRQGLHDAGASRRVVDCVSSRLRRALNGPDGDKVLAGLAAQGARAQRTMGRLLVRCGFTTAAAIPFV